jgi:hypothetical protein
MRGVAQASLVAIAFACVILLIGMPLALSVRGLHEGLSWLVGLEGDMSALAQALVSVSSVAGGILIAAALARLLVRFFHWRHRFYARVIGDDATPNPPFHRQEMAQTAGWAPHYFASSRTEAGSPPKTFQVPPLPEERKPTAKKLCRNMPTLRTGRRFWP